VSTCLRARRSRAPPVDNFLDVRGFLTGGGQRVRNARTCVKHAHHQPALFVVMTEEGTCSLNIMTSLRARESSVDGGHVAQALIRALGRVA